MKININVLNSYSLKANFLPLSYSEPRNCPEGYEIRTFDDKKYNKNLIAHKKIDLAPEQSFSIKKKERSSLKTNVLCV